MVTAFRWSGGWEWQRHVLDGFPCAARTRAAFQHSNEEIRAGVNVQYSRPWRVALESINYDNTWYYQSHCSLAESGVQWSPSQFMFYGWLLAFIKQIFPPQKKRKKNHPKNPTPKFIVKNIAFWEWTSVTTGMTWICFQSWNCFSFHFICDLHPAGLKNTEMFLDHSYTPLRLHCTSVL